MPSPKDGNAGSAVMPQAPKEAADADTADPGDIQEVKAEQRALKQGKYGAVQVAPFKPPPPASASDSSSSDADQAPPKVFVAIKMADETGKPMAGEPYQIALPDGTVTNGTLDNNGEARVDGIDPGACHVSFPNMANDEWKPG